MALKRLRTIAHILIRELQRKLPQHGLLETYQPDFLFYQRPFISRRGAQQPKDKNKIYSLHEPHAYVISKGKDSNIIVGVVSHKKNQHDAKTLPDAIKQANSNRTKPIKQAVCDRGYCGVKQVGDTDIILPSKALKKDNRYQRDKKRKLCKRRAAIEPIIGHLKSDFRLSRNRLKGQVGDEINALMAACAWNLRKWLVFCHVCYLWLKKARFVHIFGKKPLVHLIQG